MPTNRAGYALALSQDGIYPTYWTVGKNAPPQWSIEQAGKVPSHAALGGTFAAGSPVTLATNFVGVLAPGPGDDFFEHIIYLPTAIAAGVVLTTKTYTIELYSSYRRETRVFQSYLNTAGAGIVITNLPALPSSTPPQSGYSLILQILTSGPPTIQGELDFGFDTVMVVLPITGQRTILFPYEPETPIIEHLSFLTDVRTRRDGTEQRSSLRAFPRQLFEATYLLDGVERQAFQANIFDGQNNPLGMPVWFESTVATAAITTGDFTIAVESTAYTDLRAGSLMAAYTDYRTFEVLSVDSYDATHITFSSAFLGSFPAGTRILPVRMAYAEASIKAGKRLRAVESWNVLFSIYDNTVDLSSTAAFSAFNTKVLLDDPNMVDGDTLQESLENLLRNIDNETGTFQITSDWTSARPGAVKRFGTRTRQHLWEVRQLLHALRGRAISFYLPTFFPDLTVTRNISTSSAVLTITNIGYTKYIRNRQPLNVVRITFTDGSSIIRTVLSSAEIDPTEEQLTMTATFGVNKTVAQVSRVDFITKVRMDSDEVTIRHLSALGDAVVEIPVKTVLE